jgi:hypothetical protein
MSNKTLRELAKDYAKGAISKDKYRKSRTELIKGIIAGNIPVKDINYEGPLRPSSEMDDAITEGIERDRTEITSPDQVSKPKAVPKPIKQPVKQNASTKNNKKQSSSVFILVSTIIVLSLILAVILFYPKPPESSPVKASDTADDTIATSNSTVTTAATNESIVGETLIASFLSEKNWGEENLNKFIESWSALTQEEKNSATQSKRMQRMKDSIYKQFLEGKALASIDSDKALTEQQKLIEFANAIGINDSRLTLD